MRYIKEYKLFESRSDIESILKRYKITNYTINDDGTVDVDGDVNLANILVGLSNIPINFRNVSGDFWCSNNGLTSLVGCPKILGGDFYCADNRLNSLEHCPKSVGGNKFDCAYNDLVSLEYCTSEIFGDFDCHSNRLFTLKGCPKTVGGFFDCSFNKIVKLDFLPDYVGEHFDIVDNPLDPKWIGSSNWDILKLDVVQGKILYNNNKVY